MDGWDGGLDGRARMDGGQDDDRRRRRRSIGVPSAGCRLQQQQNPTLSTFVFVDVVGCIKRYDIFRETTPRNLIHNRQENHLQTNSKIRLSCIFIFLGVFGCDVSGIVCPSRSLRRCRVPWTPNN